MKFNIASTLKTVTQRLNPDLEIPNAPAPPNSPPQPTNATSRKMSSPPIPQSSFSPASTPSPKKPRKSRSTSWTKTRNRASSNVSSVFRKSSASISLPVFMGKPPEKVEEEKEMGKEGAVGENGVPVSLCRDFAVGAPQWTGSKKVDAQVTGSEMMKEWRMGKVTEEIVMEMPMDTPQRPSTPLDISMRTVNPADAISVPHAFSTVVATSPPSAVGEMQGTTLQPYSLASLLPSAIQDKPETNSTISITVTTSVSTTAQESANKTEEIGLATTKSTNTGPETTGPELETTAETKIDQHEKATAEPATFSSPLLGPTKNSQTTASTTATATATCLCTAIHLSFPLSSPTPQHTSNFLCTCLACTKTCTSLYASGYSVQQIHLTHIRGQDNLTTYTHTHTQNPEHGATAANSVNVASIMTTTKQFCRTCGTLMYSIGSSLPGYYIVYLNTVDDALRLDKEMKLQAEDVGISGLEGIRVGYVS